MSDMGKQSLTDNQVATNRFEHIYNADGTCHADNCGAPGLILAFDEFSPEVAQWFCGIHWQNCAGKEWLSIAEDLRKPMASLFGGTYEAHEAETAGVYVHRWSWPLPSPDCLVLSDHPIAINNVAPTGRLYRRYLRAVARRDRFLRRYRRARQRYRRHDRAVFRRRKRGIA